METFWRDFVYAFRVLFKRPGPTVLAVLALSLSIGMTTASFSVLNGLFLKSLPYPNGDRMYRVTARQMGGESTLMGVPLSGLRLIEREVGAFDAVCGSYSGTLNLSGDGHRATRYDGAFISGQLTAVTGVKPVLGKDFEELTSERRQRGVLISHRVWWQRYGGNPDLPGKVVRVNGAEMEIIGVLPEGFTFPYNADVWVLIGSAATQVQSVPAVIIAATLSKDSDLSTAENQLARIAPEAFGHDRSDPPLQFAIAGFGDMQIEASSGRFWLLSHAVAIIVILLITCANVANLLLSRAALRGNEMAIRSALGATRGRLIAQLLSESLVLAFLGCVGALLYAAWAIELDARIFGWAMPGWLSFDLDWRVYGFTAALMVLTALASGILPAFQASRTDLNEMLKETARTTSHFRVSHFTRILTIGQIALSCGLLFGAGLIARHFHRLENIDPPFAPSSILTLRMGLFDTVYPGTAERDQFSRRLIEEVTALPGVRHAAVTTWISETGNETSPIRVLPPMENPEAAPIIDKFPVERVSPEYFDTMGVTLLAGETFSGDAERDARTVIVDETFARTFYGSPAGALGQALEDISDLAVDGDSIYRIVGVTPDLKLAGGEQFGQPASTLYTAIGRVTPNFITLMVQSKETEARTVLDPVREVLHGIDPHLPPYFERTLRDFYDRQLMPYRVFTGAFLFVAVMALFLAAIGIYGLMSFSVNIRRQEFGVRMALGAHRRTLVRMVLAQGLAQLLVGVALGLGFVLTLGRILRLVFNDLDPTDLTVFIAVLVVLILTTIGALIVPVRRAARLSPMEALRHE